MRRVEHPKVGDNVLVVYKKDRDYPSMVHDKTENNGIIIYEPIDPIERLSLKALKSIKVKFSRPDAQYEYSAQIKRRFCERGLYLFEIIPVSDIKRIQRREYFRLNIRLKAEVRPFVQVDNQDPPPWTLVYTTDISGGGIQIGSSIDYAENQMLECKIYTAADKVQQVSASVVESIKTVDDGARGYLIRLCFDNIPDAVKDGIIKFIHQEQLGLRRNGRGTI